MSFKDQLIEAFKKGKKQREEALFEDAKLEMIFVESEFKRKLLEAASNGQTSVTFEPKSESSNFAYHLLAKCNRLKSQDSCIYQGQSARNVIVSGWCEPPFPKNTLITEGENI